MTHMIRIMTPETLIFASAMVIGILTAIKYIRLETIGLVPDGFATASILNKFRTRGTATSPILFV